MPQKPSVLMIDLGTVGLLAAVLAVRVSFAVAFPVAQVSDYASYYEEARALAGLADRSLNPEHAMGPKLLYGGVFRVFGDSLRVVGLTNAFLFTLAVAAAYLGVCRIFDRRTATWTALIWISSVSELYFNNLVCTEVLGTLFVAILFLLLARGIGGWRSLLLLGVVGGLSVYNRPALLPLGGLVFVQQALAHREVLKPLKRAAVVQVVMLVMVLPLCAINARAFGRFTPLIANAGGALWYGNNPQVSGLHVYAKLPEDFAPGSRKRQRYLERYRSFYQNPDQAMVFDEMGHYQRDDVRRRYALAWIRAHPRRYLQLVASRFRLLFFSCTYGEAPYALYDPNKPEQPPWGELGRRLIAGVRLPARAWYQVLAGGALLGLAVALLRYRAATLLSPLNLPLMLVAFYVLPYLLSAAANRYHVPILFLLWTYLGHGLETARQRWCARRGH
jgi:hypothetical protein